MKLPTNIKIGGMNYRIEEKEAPDNNPQCYGVCVYHDAHIEIKTTLSDVDT